MPSSRLTLYRFISTSKGTCLLRIQPIALISYRVSRIVVHSALRNWNSTSKAYQPDPVATVLCINNIRYRCVDGQYIYNNNMGEDLLFRPFAIRRVRKDKEKLAAQLALLKARLEPVGGKKPAAGRGGKATKRATSESEHAVSDSDATHDDSSDDEKVPGGAKKCPAKRAPPATKAKRAYGKAASKSTSDSEDTHGIESSDDATSVEEAVEDAKPGRGPLSAWKTVDTLYLGSNKTLPVRKLGPADGSEARGWLARDIASLVNVRQFWLSTRWYTAEEKYVALSNSLTLSLTHQQQRLLFVTCR